MPTVGSVPVAGLSIYDPIHFGFDENQQRVEVSLMYRNLLIGGEPGSGKSSLLNLILGHAALSADCRLWLMDAKQVELDPWSQLADEFVTNDINHAITTLAKLQGEIDIRYAMLSKAGRRKIERRDGLDVILLVIDELAAYSATYGTDEERKDFIRRLRDVLARGRAAGIIPVVATQRPSADIVPTSLRDLFGYRTAFRCTTDSSSDIILANGWASQGHSARTIGPLDHGVGLLLAEGGIPRRFKGGYLTDAHIRSIVRAARAHRPRRPDSPAA